jgi:hypothetical protein
VSEPYQQRLLEPLLAHHRHLHHGLSSKRDDVWVSGQ